MTQLAPLVRLAWRETKRRKGRTALVVALIALPVAAMTMLSILVRTSSLSAEQLIDLEFGPLADAEIAPVYADQGTQSTSPDLPPPLPAGSRFVRVRYAVGRFPAGSPLSRVGLVATDAYDPLLAPVMRFRTGGPPGANDEVALSSDLARLLNTRVGSILTMRQPAGDFRVTGLFERPLFPSLEILIASTNPAGGGYARYVADVGPATEAEVAAGLSGSGWQLGSTRWDLRGRADRDGEEIAMLYTGGAIALFITGIVCAAAFAASARRQLRQIGVLAANGADPRALRHTLALQGTASAFVGAVAGLALGVGGLAVIAPHFHRWRGRILPGIDWRLSDLVLIVLLALVAGTIAAAVPGRVLARSPILASLAGRRAIPPVDHHRPVRGFALAGAGLALLGWAATPSRLSQNWFFAALGSVLVLSGGVLCAGWVASYMERVGNRLGGPARLATRRLARHRSRTGPLIGAIMATSAGAIAMGAITLSQERRDAALFAPILPADQILLSRGPFGRDGKPIDENIRQNDIDRLTALIPGATVARFDYLDSRFGLGGSMVHLNFPNNGWAAIGVVVTVAAGPDLLRLVSAPADVVAAAEAGKVIVAGDEPILRAATVHASVGGQDRVVADTPYLTPSFEIGPRTKEVACDSGGSRCHARPGAVTIIVPPDLASQIGLDPNAKALVRAPKPLDKADRTALETLRIELSDTDDETFSILFENRARSQIWIQRFILTGLVVLMALGVTAIGLALMAAEGRDDEAALMAIGAPPGTTRRTRAAEAALLAGLGALMAIPIGMIPAAVFMHQRMVGNPITTPWGVLATLVLAMPLVAAAGGWLSARTPRRIEFAID